MNNNLIDDEEEKEIKKEQESDPTFLDKLKRKLKELNKEDHNIYPMY